MLRRLAGLSLVLLAVASPVAAQVPATLAARPDVRAVLDAIRARNDWTIDRQIELCEIPAPPFKETARGEAYKRAFERLGLRNVRIDSVGNVIAIGPDYGNGWYADWVTMKVAPNGVRLWSRLFDALDGNNEIPGYVAVDPFDNVLSHATHPRQVSMSSISRNCCRKSAIVLRAL